MGYISTSCCYMYSSVRRREGLQMTYHVFHMTVWRARKTRKPTATGSWGKQDKPSESQGLQEAKVETS